MTKKLYDEERDTDGYDNLVMKHMSAMTTESLHSKSAIAVELAYRDMQIEQFKDEWRSAEKNYDILFTNYEEAKKRMKELEQALRGVIYLCGFLDYDYVESSEYELYLDYARKALEGKL